MCWDGFLGLVRIVRGKLNLRMNPPSLSRQMQQEGKAGGGGLDLCEYNSRLEVHRNHKKKKTVIEERAG